MTLPKDIEKAMIRPNFDIKPILVLFKIVYIEKSP